jgi:hypothetical protein
MSVLGRLKSGLAGPSPCCLGSHALSLVPFPINATITIVLYRRF